MLVPVRVVAHLQFACEVFYAQAFAGEKNDEMVYHVRTLIDETLVGAVACLYHCFECLFSHFLCHAVESVLEERCGVASFWHLLVSAVDEVLQVSEEEQRVFLVCLSPAGVASCVACRTLWVGLHEQCVVVAVNLYVNKVFFAENENYTIVTSKMDGENGVVQVGVQSPISGMAAFLELYGSFIYFKDPDSSSTNYQLQVQTANRKIIPGGNG